MDTYNEIKEQPPNLQPPSPPDKSQQSIQQPPLLSQPQLTDNLMIMLVKQMQYVESLTGLSTGFIWRRDQTLIEDVTEAVIPEQYLPLWQQIAQGESLRCRRLRIFLRKMVASKGGAVLREFFQLYMLCVEKMIYIEAKFKPQEYTERQLIEFSKLFSKNFLKRIVIQNEQHEFLQIDANFTGMALLSREISVKEVAHFQQNFKASYRRWRREFGHLIEVIYFCLSVEFYGLPINYLYDGYFRNTVLKTQRNIPKRDPKKP